MSAITNLISNSRLASTEATLQNLNLFGCQFEDYPNMIFYLKSATMPGRAAGMGQLMWMNGMFFFTRTPEIVGEWQAEFLLDESMTAYAYLQKWFEECFNVDRGTLGKTKEVKKRIDVFLISNNGENKTMIAQMHRSILQTIAPINLQMGAGTAVEGVIDAPTVAASFKYEIHQVYFDQSDMAGPSLANPYF